MAIHPDLQAEQSHIDRAYDRLEAMRTFAREMLRDALQATGGTFQAVEQREVVVNSSLQRLSRLEIGRESLVFGRVDREDGEVYHIGRLAVSDEDQEPLVVDWRAPVAEPFYRATGRHAMGLRRRRHFATDGRRLVGIEDELFGEDALVSGGLGPFIEPDLAPAAEDGPASGALLAALERSRGGVMRDIVATVQREQDEIIRADLPGVLVVQGGPGTGKTAVALHRAAYLLYTHRFPLERQGVLVVGPNPLFLRYIGQVLPSLGESGVSLSTIEGLVPWVRARAADGPQASRVKSDSRMAKVLRRAVGDRQRPLRRDLVVGYGPVDLRLTVEATAQIISQARRRPGAHNARRRFVEATVGLRLAQQYIESTERSHRLLAPPSAPIPGPDGTDDDFDDGGLEGGPGEQLDEQALARTLRRLPAVAEALDRMWPVLTPEELLHDLFGAPPLIALAGRNSLTDEEMPALARPRSTSLEEIPWTPADLPLLDEARVLLGTRRPSEDDAVRAYGHIVVDEAQDLTPMQLRMLGRRSISGSMTIVGDIAQATGQRAPESWEEVLGHMLGNKTPRVVELSVNYRTPAEIMALAGQVLAVAAPGLRQPRSVRATETPPAFVPSTPETLGADVASTVRREQAQLSVGPGGAGALAVICPPSLHDPLATALRDAGIAFGDAEADGLEQAVTLVPVTVVKGLEFDGVVVVEPAAIVAETPQGLRSLYVALTRSTRRLAIVSAAALPAPLTEFGEKTGARAPVS